MAKNELSSINKGNIHSFKKHLFVLDHNKKDRFYFALGIKKEGISVLRCWKSDFDFERYIIPFNELNGMEFVECSYRQFIADYAFYSKEKVGWLEPSGYLYQCGMFNHSGFAWWYFGGYERTLENKGFVKVAANDGIDKRAYALGNVITEAQYHKLLSIGFSEKNISHFSVVH